MKITQVASVYAIATSVVLLNSPCLAGTSAKQAVETLTKTEGSQITNNIVRLTGRFGQDQPQEWEILARRGEQFAMFIVDRDAVLSVSKIRTRAPKNLPVKTLKLDSTQAFTVTDKAAKKANVGFDSLNYDLRPRADSAAPVWIVSLRDIVGTTVGEVHIAADSGSILRTNWDREQLNRPAAPIAASTGGTRGVLANRNRSTQTGTTLDGVRDGLANVGNSIKGVFRRGEVSNQTRQRRPKTTKTRPN